MKNDVSPETETNNFDLSGEFAVICEENIIEQNEPLFESVELNLDNIQFTNTDYLTQENSIDTNEACVDIKESKAKKLRLLDLKTVEEISSKFNLNEKDSDNLKKLNISDAINVGFFVQLREILKKVPTKSKIMDEFNIRKSYTGFHDWIDGNRIDLPTVGMNSIAQNLGYSLMVVPIKNDNLNSKYKSYIDNLQLDFLDEIADRVDNINKVDSSKIKPKKTIKEENNQLMVNAIKADDNDYKALGFTEEHLEKMNEDIIDENETFVDLEPIDIEERTTILNDTIVDNITHNEPTFNPTNFKMEDLELETCSQQIIETPLINQYMNFDYDDSLEHDDINEKK